MPEEAAPTVVAVVVTSEAGPYFDATLNSLAAQDYPSLTAVVVDAASGSDTPARVATAIPGAYVRRLESNPGYAAAANQALETVEGAAYLLFCHDDVALDSDAVRQLVEESYRSNAGIVTPKFVDWEDVSRLQHVGAGLDRIGGIVPLVEPGELDHEQHDRVRDVFVAPGGCMLVRADLFSSLGGFDEGMTMLGEDVDLSWRTQLIGARVVVAPAARVRHVGATEKGYRWVGTGKRSRTRAASVVAQMNLRHRIRAVLKNTGSLRLLTTVPVLLLVSLVGAVNAAIAGHFGEAIGVAKAWGWNIRRIGEIRAARRSIQETRVVSDRAIRRVQVPVTARMFSYVGTRAAEHGGRQVAAAGRQMVSSFGQSRWTVWVWLGLVVVWCFGSRHLLLGEMPVFEQLAAFPDGPTGFIRPIVGFPFGTLESVLAIAPANALLAMASLLLFGATGLLAKLLLLGALPVGVVGVYRAAKVYRSQVARLVAAVAYAAMPVALDALADGDIGVLAAYALAPWILAGLGVNEIFVKDDETASPRRKITVRTRAVRVAVGVTVLAMVVPLAAGTIVLASVGVLVGGFLAAGSVRAGVRSVVAAVMAVGIAVIVLGPWLLDLGWDAFRSTYLADDPGGPVAIEQVLRLEADGAGPALSWVWPAVAALPLLTAKSWRLSASIRLWFVVAFVAGSSWADAVDLIDLPVAPLGVTLAFVGAAFALNFALAVVAFQEDLPDYRFGWRQIATVAAAVASVAALAPLLAGAVNGRWSTPATGLDEELSILSPAARVGDYRVVWVGVPEALPLRGWNVDDDFAVGVSRNGLPSIVQHWPGQQGFAGERLELSVQRVLRRDEVSVGRALAPFSIRYIAVPHADGKTAASARLVRALDGQADLRRVVTTPAVTLYENPAARAWVTVANPNQPTEVLHHERTGPGELRVRARPGVVTVSEPFAKQWNVRLDGRRVSTTASPDGLVQFKATNATTVTMEYEPAQGRYVLILLGTLLGLGLLILVARSSTAGTVR